MARNFKDVRLRIIYVLIFVTIIFMLGIFLGYYLVEKRIESIESLTKDILVSIEDIDLINNIARDPCVNNDYLNFLSKQFDKYAIKLTYLEELLGKNSKKIQELKKPYTILIIKHYFAIKEQNEKCNQSYITILFFYSNKKHEIGLSENQGVIIDHIRKKFENKPIMVYAIDANLDLKIIDLLKDKYNITKVPAVVINDVTYGYLDKNSFEKIIYDILE